MTSQSSEPDISLSPWETPETDEKLPSSVTAIQEVVAAAVRGQDEDVLHQIEAFTKSLQLLLEKVRQHIIFNKSMSGNNLDYSQALLSVRSMDRDSHPAVLRLQLSEMGLFLRQISADGFSHDAGRDIELSTYQACVLFGGQRIMHGLMTLENNLSLDSMYTFSEMTQRLAE